MTIEVSGADCILSGEGFERHVARSALPGELMQAIGRIAIAQADPGDLCLHGSALVRADHTVVLCGPSGSGKSTLTATAMQAGWSLLAEETVFVDAAGRAHPFLRPISLKIGSQAQFTDLVKQGWQGADEWLLPPTALGLTSSIPMPVDAIVIPAYTAGAPVMATRLKPTDAILWLAANSSSLARTPRPLHRLQRLAVQAQVTRLTYGDARAALEVLADLAGSV